MRGRSALAILLAILLSLPVVGGTTTTMAEDEETKDPCDEAPEQPCVNKTSTHLWSDGSNRHWIHFNTTESENAADNLYSNDRDNGVVTVDERFTMTPKLNKKLNMTVGGEIRIVLNIYLEGDWTNNDQQSGGDQGPCNQDCEELNISLWSGASEIVKQHVPQVSQGWNTVTVSHIITEEQSLWDSSAANPSLQIEMKLKGDRQNSGPGGIFIEGEPANFTLRLSADGETRVELPIDRSSWEEGFQNSEDDDDVMMPEEQPGFLFMAAITAMTVAAVYLPSREESEDS